MNMFKKSVVSVCAQFTKDLEAISVASKQERDVQLERSKAALEASQVAGDEAQQADKAIANVKELFGVSS